MDTVRRTPTWLRVGAKAVVVGIVLVSGCYKAPILRVEWKQPAPVHLGQAKRLSIVQSEGRRSAKEFVINSFLKQARAANVFQVADRTEEGITVKPVGRNVEVSGGKGNPHGPDEIAIRMDVMDWGAESDEKTVQKPVERQRSVTKTNSKGKAYTTTENYTEMVSEDIKVYRGKAVLSVTAFNKDGTTYFAEKEFVGNGEIQKGGGEKEAATEMAAVDAVRQLLAAVTPSTGSGQVMTDGDDEKQRPILDAAQKGELNAAIDQMKAYVDANPASSSAMYNLAAFLDAKGAFQEALPWYEKAVAGAGEKKDKYTSAKLSCAERVAAVETLAH